MQQAASRIPGELPCKPGNGIARAFSHSSATLRRSRFQICKSFPEPDSIELTYGKHANAALRATRTTGEPFAASARRVGKRGVHNLHQLLISKR
jgi:hypothetical protein